ncbi:hypothetical protein PV05_04482 [Exophiala xenobiotica]|uniref:Uncharacterized protein n=1 Tax=Exophiala xenobiotica TaxID=348802 RepID=A0A0D2EJZ2_9EURO|nr:uncharacterized protein PV05_04482 [Exophiala xenobiotica]KIW55753.1 hypothetical protein PV05_04482 [Exophiala xenobiotica]
MNGADKGTSSDTYFAAAEFLKRRELAGVKMPRQKKAKTTSNTKETKHVRLDGRTEEVEER